MYRNRNQKSGIRDLEASYEHRSSSIEYRVSTPSSHPFPILPHSLTPILFLLLVSLAFGKEASPALPTLHKKITELGFKALPVPLRLYNGRPPALTKKGVPEVPELKLKYVPDEEKIVPAEITVELTAAEYSATVKNLFAAAEPAPPAALATGQTCSLTFAGVSPIRLVDLQFSKAIDGDRKALQEYLLPVAALTAKKATLQFQGQDASYASDGVVLAAEYREMHLKVSKKRVLLDIEHPVVRLGKKPKDPRYKRIALSFLRPESGEDPSTIIASVGRMQFPCEIVMGSTPQTVKERKQPKHWVFRGRQGAMAEELILPSQFDGKEALGVFLRITSHKKEAFSPRTREIKLEAILAYLEL
ncbi:MAG: hypothetical protein QF437_01245 [Planctomycetota bacterium]|jgi:hypothetical protein|nr:hypothetical protein [Planctomycetota bacterium]MDP7129077.1 hypothetical protein [Planctomycetota bacterium]MDP7249498.1 hypothetical protein [Planctomycetota bacterium]